MADDAAERLRVRYMLSLLPTYTLILTQTRPSQLLESIQSLLSPTLPSPPPSPPLEHDHKTLAPPPPQGQFLTASASISSFKRKLGDDDEPTEGGNKMVVGLGLGEGTQVGGEDTRYATAGRVGSVMKLNSRSSPTYRLPRSRVPTGNDHSSSKPPTPDLRSSPFPAPTPKLRNNTFPSPTPQSPVFGKPGEDWRITFPKDRLRKLATRCVPRRLVLSSRVMLANRVDPLLVLHEAIERKDENSNIPETRLPENPVPQKRPSSHWRNKPKPSCFTCLRFGVMIKLPRL